MFRLTYTIHSGIIKTNDTTHLNNEIHTRPSAFITRKLVNKWILAGLLACSILDAFPFRNGTVAFGVSRTRSELTAAVSAQDFHLIPFSLIILKNER